jgi:hypothetical protein
VHQRPVDRATPSPARLSEGDGPSERIGPSKFIIDTLVRNSREIQRCIATARAAGVWVEGKLVMKFTVSPQGEVSNPRVTTSRFRGTALDRCVSEALSGLPFSAFPGTPKLITYPLLVAAAEPTSRDGEEEANEPTTPSTPSVQPPGKLSVQASPGHAKVYIDSRYLSTTPLVGEELPPGTYQLRLINDRLGADITDTVTIESGKTTVKAYRLDRAGQ